MSHESFTLAQREGNVLYLYQNKHYPAMGIGKELGANDSLSMTHIFAFDKTIKGYYTNTNYQERTC